MMEADSRVRFTEKTDGRGRFTGNAMDGDPGLGELFKRLTTDTGTLVSQEVALAKSELRESVAAATKVTSTLMVAITIANAGVIALTACAVMALSGVTGSYWLAALIIGIANIAIGLMLASSAKAAVKSRDLKPVETLDSLRTNKEWAGREARSLKQTITGDRPHANHGR